MTHTTDQERAEFEVWLAPEYSREKWHTGEYTDDTVYSMFAAWQAARRTPVVPYGWKLVPEVPTMEMVSAGDKNAYRVSWVNGKADVVPAIYHAMISAAPLQSEVDSTTKHKGRD